MFKSVLPKLFSLLPILFSVENQANIKQIYVIKQWHDIYLFCRGWGEGDIFFCKKSKSSPRSSDAFYIVSNYMKWVTTSWTYSKKCTF